MQSLRTFLVGIVLGIANVIPGVSGGTMAVVFGVYDRLIAAITLNLKKILKDLPFLLLLGAGLVTGIILFSNIVTWLFGHWPHQTNFFFLGIILGSIPFIHVRAKGSGFKAGSWVALVLGIAVMAVMYVLDNGRETGAAVITRASPEILAWLFAMGFVAAVTMIIPGISGSFVLLILGAYETIIRAVSDMNFPLLVPVAFGVIAGLLLGAQLVRFLLTRFHGLTYAAIYGLVIGSLLPVFPGFPAGLIPVAGSVFALAAGTFISWFFSKTEKTDAGDLAGAGAGSPS